MDCIMQRSLGDNTIYLELSTIWRRDRSLAERENMQYRGASDSRATADSHCAAQGSRNEMETSWQRSCRDVLLIWLVKLQERVKRVDAFVRDNIEYGCRAVYDDSVLFSLPERSHAEGLEDVPTDSEISLAISKLHDSAPGASGLRASAWKALADDRTTFDLIRNFCD